MIDANIGRIVVDEQELQQRIRDLGKQIAADYDDHPPLLVGILKGAFMFMADLARAIDLPVEFDFMAVSSYGAATRTSGVERVEKAVREILFAIGEDPDRDGLLRTPRRVAEMYAEICSGLHEDPSRHLIVTFEANHDEMVLVRDIALYSMCEHHLAPFHGRAHVAYIPGDDGRLTGLSKIARLVDGFAKRPQVQERLTTQIADAIVEVLQPRGAFVMIEAEHLCMSMR